MTDELPQQPVNPMKETWRQPVAVGFSKGIDWFLEGWTIFLKAPLIFAVMGAVFLVGMTLVNLVPVIGWILSMVFWPHLLAGLYQACRQAYFGETVQFADFFAGLVDIKPLAALGAVYLAGVVMLFIMLGATVVGTLGFDVLGALLAGDGSQFDPQATGKSLALSLLVTLLLFIPFLMAFIFSPILIHRHQMPLLEAMSLSFLACLRNFMAFLIWGLVWFMFMLLMLALMWLTGIGAILSVVVMVGAGPVYAANIYAAYEAIFQVGDQRVSRLI